MSRGGAGRGLALAAALLGLACAPERRVFVGGPVVTLDAGSRVAEALGVEGERIAVVGSASDVRAWAGGNARVTDLAGRALLPGFIDAHGHFPGSGIYALVADLNSPPIGRVRTLEQLVDALRAQADATPAGEWVVGLGYDDTLLAEGRHPTRDDLDRVSDRHPVAAVHISGHLAAVNGAALGRMGVSEASADPEGGHYQREPETGRLTGVLEETAMEPVMASLLAPGLWDGVRIVREASRRALAAGVTTAQMGYATEAQADGVRLLSRLGLVPLRVVLWPEPALADAALAGERELETHDPLHVRWGAVKIVADGSIQGYTAYLRDPYHVPPGDDPDYRGYPRVPRAKLLEQVERYHAAGFQVAVHGNGDASIDDILDAFERAQREHPRPDPRFVVIHAQMARPDQLARMARLGAIPSFFALHVFYWGDRHRTRFLGPERAARISPARRALAAGLRFTLHCDAPVVPLEPLRLVATAVRRQTRSGVVLGPDERLTPQQALRAITLDAAWQHFEEAEKGSLEPGKLADLVVLSGSPLEVPEAIETLRVLETIVGGETVWRASNEAGY